MEKKMNKASEKSAGIRVERSVYDKAMKMKQDALKNDDARAYSTQSWFSMLITKGMAAMVEEIKANE
jgi:hypothetical protein